MWVCTSGQPKRPSEAGVTVTIDSTTFTPLLGSNGDDVGAEFIRRFCLLFPSYCMLFIAARSATEIACFCAIQIYNSVTNQRLKKLIY